MSKEDNLNDDDEYKVELLPEDYPQYDLSFKLIFIGDSGVGKSCLTTKAVKNTFEEFYQATVGFEFLTFNLKINDKIIKLQIWDTCGQEVYKSLISNFYRNSSLAVLLYSIDNRESFTHAENWLNELKSQAQPDIRIILVGNKSDLEDQRKVQKEEGEKYKEDQQLDLFIETSAKTGYNARNVLVEAAKLLYKDFLIAENGLKKNNNEKEDEKKIKIDDGGLIKKDKYYIKSNKDEKMTSFDNIEYKNNNIEIDKENNENNLSHNIIINSKEKILNERIDTFRNRCIESLGMKIFMDAYNYLAEIKKNKNKKVNNSDIRSNLINIFGKNNIGYWHLLEQIFILQDLLKE